MTTTQPRVDRVGSIETKGIEQVTEPERHGRAGELYWLWLSADLAIQGVIFGAIEAVYGLNLWQAVVVTVAAIAISFGLVGLVSVAGPRFGLPTMTVSRLAFGRRGNSGPALVSWISLVGWEVIAVVIPTYALLDLAGLAGLRTTKLLTAAALALSVGLIVIFGVLGHATLVWLLRIVGVVFGLLTLMAAVQVAVDTRWHSVLHQPAGPWGTGVFAALTILTAGTGLGWANAGADYTRYLPRSTSPRAIVGWTIGGAMTPCLILFTLGFILALRAPLLAQSANPIEIVNGALPHWMEVPLLLTAIVGMLAAAIPTIYSSGLTLLSLGLPVPRYASVLVDGAVMTGGAVYVLFVSTDFLTPFQSFVQLVGIALAAWVAVMVVYLFGKRRIEPAGGGGVNPAAVVAWLAGLTLGLLFSSSALFLGPFAKGIFATSSLSFVVSFAVSGIVFILLSRTRWAAGRPAPAGEVEQVRSGSADDAPTASARPR